MLGKITISIILFSCITFGQINPRQIKGLIDFQDSTRTGYFGISGVADDTVKAWIGDSLDNTLRRYSVSLYDYIGAYDTTGNWTNVLQSAVDNAKGKTIIIPADTQYVYLFEKQGDNPYAGTKDYCIDLGTGNISLIIMPGAVLKLADGQQTDAGGAVDIIIFKDASDLYIGGGGEITGNTAGQTGWSGGYSQAAVNGGIIVGYGTTNYVSNYNIRIENLKLNDHWSNPVDISKGNKIVLRNLSTWGTGEGFQLQRCTNILIDNLYIDDSTEVSSGDAIEVAGCLNFSITNSSSPNPTSGIDVFASQNGVVKNCRFGGGTQAGTDVEGLYVDNVLVADCIFGATLAGAGGTIIYDNVIVDSTDYGFQFATPQVTGSQMGEIIVRNSTFMNLTSSGGIISGDINVTIENCLFENTVYDGLHIVKNADNDTPNVKIKNSTFKDIGRYGIYYDTQGDTVWTAMGSVSGSTFENITGLDGNYYIVGETGNIIDGGNITPKIEANSNEQVGGVRTAYMGSDIETLYGLDQQILTIHGRSSRTIRDKTAYGSGNINLKDQSNYTIGNGESITIQFNGDSTQWYEVTRNMDTPAEVVEPEFTNDNNFGADRHFNARINNFLYAGDSRFGISDTGFTLLNRVLFDNNYDTYGTIDTADTGIVYIDFTTKGDSLIGNPEGYILLNFASTGFADTVIGEILYADSTNWTDMTDLENISNNDGYRIYKLTIGTTNNIEQFRFYIIAPNDAQTYLSEIEYYRLRPDPLHQPNVNKYQSNSLYGDTLDFRDTNNVQKAYIASQTGNAGFDGTVTIGEYTLPNTDGSSGQVLKTDGAGNVTWQGDISGSGSDEFNPDDIWIDTTASGEATVSQAVKDTIAMVKNKLDASDTTDFRTFSDSKYQGADATLDSLITITGLDSGLVYFNKADSSFITLQPGDGINFNLEEGTISADAVPETKLRGIFNGSDAVWKKDTYDWNLGTVTTDSVDTVYARWVGQLLPVNQVPTLDSVVFIGNFFDDIDSAMIVENRNTALTQVLKLTLITDQNFRKSYTASYTFGDYPAMVWLYTNDNIIIRGVRWYATHQ